VEYIAKAHEFFLSLNDAYEYNFTDKELHFLVIGVLGMLMIFVVYPTFKWLVKKNHIMTIAWIYVFTLILVITFAIEIGQKVTNTGAMEFADIVMGIFGFIVMYLIFVIIRAIYHGICRILERSRKRRRK
jgi:glycopeptide antibiotics resistance protein